MAILCASCGFDNPPGMKFCGNCGTRLKLDPEPPDAGEFAGAKVQPFTSQFGPLMGADLADRMRLAGLELAGQRRNVTILFADISGSTALAERLDGEDLYEILQETIQVLANNVYKYEGVVDKIIGDGLMALFGAPISHENNAERAVRAALDMQNDLLQLAQKIWSEHNLELSVRIGLHSGPVIIGSFGADDLMLNYTAVGDTVNMAHRIEEAAPPGSTLVSEAVYRQVRSVFDCQQLTVLNPKGITHPVVAYRVLNLKPRRGVLGSQEGFSAPMIGRDQELVALKHAAEELFASRRGHFAIITGEAGLGKSRLINEFTSLLDTHQVQVLEGQSLAYRRLSYWLFRELLYSYLQLPATTSPLQTRERLARCVFQRIGIQAKEALPFLEHLMSLPQSDLDAEMRLKSMDASQLRQQILLTVRDLIAAEAEQPLVIILEDLHWADEASLELLAFLLELLRSKPIFVIAASRSIQDSSLGRVIGWARHNLSDRFHDIRLQNLSRDLSKQLLLLLLSISDLPDDLREQILERSAGNPFYLEEILRMLIDQGLIQNERGRWQVVPGAEIGALGVPDTLKDLILARFDRLQPEQRRLLQAASVIGKDFDLPVLAAVLRSNSTLELHSLIDSLIEREFILPNPHAPDTEFTFRHVFMSDAIYATLLRKEKQSLHGQVAEIIERMYADRIDEQVEMLANHFRWSADKGRALHYLLLAGQKSVRNQIYQQAHQYFDAALGLLDQVEPSDYQVYQSQIGMGEVQLYLGEYPEARRHYQAALSTLEKKQETRNIAERSMVHRKIARTYERQGSYDDAQAQLETALKVLSARPEAYPAEKAMIWNDRAWIDFRRGSFAEAGQLLHKALALVENSDAYEVTASIYNRLGGVAYNQGDWERAVVYLRKSIAIRESSLDLVSLANSLNNLGLLEIEMGQFDSALATLTRGYELKVRLGQTEGIAMALNNIGWLQIQRGDLDEANRLLNSALDLAQQIGYTSLRSQALMTLGEMYTAAEDWPRALQVLKDALQIVLDLGSENQLADIYRQLGEAEYGQGDCAQAGVWLEQAGRLLEKQPGEARNRAGLTRAEYLRLQGRLATSRGDFETAKKYLEESREAFEQSRNLLGQGRVLFSLGEWSLAKRDAKNAWAYLDQAGAIFAQVGARLDAERAAALSSRVLS